MSKKITVRDVAEEHPEIKLYDYKFMEGGHEPEYLSDILEDLGYKFKYEEDYESQGEYNDIKGYYNIEVEII